jgi:hypothetical protein
MSAKRDFTQKHKPLIPPSPDGSNSGDEGVAGLLDSMLPGGKRLRNATGRECLQAGDEWLRWVGESVGEQDIIGATLSEVEVVRILFYGPGKSTESDLTDADRAYLDALDHLARTLVALGVQATHELIEEEAGSALLFDLQLAITGVNTEFHDELYKLACGEGSTENVTEFEVEIFFGSAEGAAAGKQALEAEGFTLEPRPGDDHRMMAYSACSADADTPKIVLELEALIKPHGGMVHELGPTGPEGGPALPRLYQLAKRDPEQPGCSND